MKKDLICNAHFMLSSLYFFDDKQNVIWGKDVLLDIMDDHNDAVLTIEEFFNIKKDHTSSG